VIKVPENILKSQAKNKALLIGDSYGTAREKPSETVSQNETWPVLLANNIYNLNWICERDFATYRCLIECVNLIKEKNEYYDVIVIGAGIVDIFPRTLPYKISRSRNIGFKIFRFFVRSIRQFWLRNIRWQPWFEIQDIDNAIIEALPFCRKLILLTVPPLIKSHADENPDAQDLLDQFNHFIKQKATNSGGQIYCVDIDKLVREKGVELYLDTNDSHFNVSGNELAAKSIENTIKTIC